MNAPTCAQARRSHVWELLEEAKHLTATIMANGPTVATAKRLGVVGELLAAHLHDVETKSPRSSISQTRFKAAMTGDHANHMRAIIWGRKTSLKQLVAQTGLDRGTLHDAEKTRRDPRLSTMLAIANALQTPAADIWPSLKAVRVAK